MKQFEIEDEVEIKEKGNEPSEGRLDDEPASDTIQDQSPDITADDGQDQDFDMIAKDSSNDYLSLAKDHHDGGDENFFGGNDNGGDGGENDADPDSDHDKNEDQDDPVEAEEGSTENEMTDLIGSITDLIEKNNLKSLRTLLHQLDEVEALFIVNSLPRNHKVLVFRLLDKDCALFVFEQLETPLQRELLESFTGEFCREMLEELDPDDRAALLDEMPAKVAKSLLSLLSPEERKVTNMLMGYQPETAGRIMTPEFITLYRTMTAAQALEKIRRQAPNKEIIYVLYVTDDHKMLEGVISLKDILIADPDKKIEEIMSDSVIKVATDTDQEKAAQLLKEFDFMALPVVDKEGRIVGIITHDDAMDILEHEATEDIFNQAGFADIAGKETNRSEALVRGGLPRVWWIRLPYLLVALIAGLLTGIVIGEFEEILKIVPLIFVFVPVIMDMSGSVGTQSTTLFVRGVSLGHIDTRRFSKHLARESIVGLTMGLILGGLAGVIAAIWGHIAIGSGTLGLAVGLSVFASMTIAAILGFLVPFILLKLKLDQAAGATPLITVIKDMISITIYFLFCNLFLGYLLIV